MRRFICTYTVTGQTVTVQVLDEVHDEAMELFKYPGLATTGSLRW